MDSIYLGNCFVFSKNKTKDFNKLKERVTARIESWNGQLLSKARKITLRKSDVQAIPTYSMSTFKLSERVCNALDAAVKRFWWKTNNKNKIFFGSKVLEGYMQTKRCWWLGFQIIQRIQLSSSC